MTFLKTDKLIEPIHPGPNHYGKSHYLVEYELVMIIDGRNLTYQARWPMGGEITASKEISIAAAFIPGTA
jgi:hypothetical protein